MSPSLWLQDLQHTGFDNNGATGLAAPTMHFGGDPKPNLVTTAAPSYLHYRLSYVDTGAGHITTAVYASPECTTTNVGSMAWDQFTLRCYPQWNGSGWSYYQKYVVTKVVDHDQLTGSPDVETNYTYTVNGSSSPVLWHYGADEATAHRSWTDFAGYSTVTTTVGVAGGQQSVSKKLYYRGMNGDYTSSGARSVTVTDSVNPAVTDTEGLRGTLREEQTLDGSTVMAKTIHQPWVTVTGSRDTVTLIGIVSSRYNREAQTDTGTLLTPANTWRWARTTHTYNTYGLEATVKSDGDPAVTTDDVCTTNTYATPDTTKWLIDYAVQAVSTDCATTPAAADYLVGTQTFYDGTTTVGATPTRGLTTMTKKLASVSGSTLSWVQDSRAGYDTNGRLTDAYDRLDKHSTTAYTPASGTAVTSTTVTNPLGQATVTTLNPLRELAVKVIDPNNKTTTVEYDPLGRLTKVFRTHSAANGPTTSLPDIEYVYTLRATGGANVVTTKQLGPNNTQIVSYELYDGMLRLRQTQAPSPDANPGRIVTFTDYDNRGLTVKTSTFWNNGAPADNVVGFADTDVTTQHRYTYDNLGRQTADALWSANVLKWQTTTLYQGDRVATTPPAGGTTTQVLLDVHGKTTELRQFATTNLAGSYTSTTYGYDRLDRLTSTTDPAGNSWTSHYDLRGRVDSSSDPDKGTTSTAYSDTQQQTTTTDARGISLTTTYDDLDRPTALYDGAGTSGFKRAQWTYDTVAKGTLTSSTRNVGSDSFTTTVTGYDDAYRPLGSTTTIPASLSIAGLPAGSYTTNTTYNVDGSVATVGYPAAGDLPAETVTTTYDTTGRPLTMASPAATYVAGTSYYNLGAPFQQIIGAPGKRLRQTTTIDQATGRLTTATTDTENQTTPNSWVEQLTQNYSYDPAGDVTAINETTAGTTVSDQCFTYDNLGQLTEAWTTTATTCQTTPSLGVVGGPDPYWTSYSYTNPTGNRSQEVRHALSGTNTTRDYTYPATGQRHTLTSVTTSGGATGTDSFQYDLSGNMKTRNLSGKPGQTLTWDNEGHLATIADTSGTTSYIYDANGNRLVAKDPTGVTVYLGGYELRRVGSTTTCTRYIGAATRTASGITWILSDPHGTGELAVNATTMATTRRKTDPFGNPRGTDPTWPNPHGFVGGIRDNTGLTHLGAREYDPATGNFISDDPVTKPSDPQQLNGYAYANNAPTTSTDPTGLATDNQRYPHGQMNDSNPNYNPGTPPAPPSDADKAKADDIKKKSAVDVIIAVGGQILLDLLGVTDIINCFTKGDIGACASTLANVVPFGEFVEVGRVLKAAWRVGKEIIKFIKDVKWADRVLEEAAAAERALPELEKAGEEVATAGEEAASAGDEAAGAANPPCHSFDPDTPVLMADGSVKPIKDVTVGDQVTTTDTLTGKTLAEPVTALHKNQDTDLADVTVIDANGTTTVLHTTAHHPFWDAAAQQWTEAQYLRPGTELSAADGSRSAIVGVATFAGLQTMRDLTVRTIHAYYVVAGATSILVHNCDPVFRVDSRGPDEIFQNGFEPKGNNMDLEMHASGVTGSYGIPDSGYVATTRSEREALSRQASNGGNSYTICRECAGEGVDVNARIPDNVHANEQEIAYPGPISGSCIISCRLPSGEVVMNPGYGG